MNDTDRLKLRFGPYQTPQFKYGDIVQCKVWGEVEIIGLTDASIQWPLGMRVGKHGGRPTLVVFDCLVNAVRQESKQAICHWWGVSPTTVWKWRKALNAPLANQGTVQVRSEHFHEDWAIEARKKSHAKARDPERRAKIAAARRGKKRPAHVIEAVRQANTGRKLSATQRQKMSESHKKRGTRPPWLNSAWTAEEDALLRTLAPNEVAERTGRSLAAVMCRRHKLKLPDRRRQVQKHE